MTNGNRRDFTTKVDGLTDHARRFAGHMETGRRSFSDPAMGGLAVGDRTWCPVSAGASAGTGETRRCECANALPRSRPGAPRVEYGVFLGKVCIVLMRYKAIISRERIVLNARRTALPLLSVPAGARRGVALSSTPPKIIRMPHRRPNLAST
jgi:hypothetical protein